MLEEYCQPITPIPYCFWFGALGQGRSPGRYFNNYLTVDLCVIYKESNKEESTVSPPWASAFFLSLQSASLPLSKPVRQRSQALWSYSNVLPPPLPGQAFP